MKETIKIEGMMCDGCMRSVFNVLNTLPLENKVVALGSAEVEYDEGKVKREQIVAAIEGAGYEVKRTVAA